MSKELDKYIKFKLFDNVPYNLNIKDLSDPYNVIYRFCTEDAPTIIVKYNPFNKFHLREILTNIPFDTIYTVIPEDDDIYYIGAPFKKYSSFIKMDGYVTYEELKSYIEQHKDIDAYKQYLLSIKKAAEERCNAVIEKKKKSIDAENVIVRKLIREAQKKNK